MLCSGGGVGSHGVCCLDMKGEVGKYVGVIRHAPWSDEVTLRERTASWGRGHDVVTWADRTATPESPSDRIAN